MARHCRRDEGLEDSEKRWWCMMEKGVGLHVLVLGMEEQACMYVHMERSPFQQGPRAMPPCPNNTTSPRTPPPLRDPSCRTLPSANPHPGRFYSYINSSKSTCELPRPFELAKDEYLGPEHFGILACWFGCVPAVTIMRPPGLLGPLIHSNSRLLVRTQPRSQSFSLGCLVSRAPTR